MSDEEIASSLKTLLQETGIADNMTAMLQDCVCVGTLEQFARKHELPRSIAQVVFGKALIINGMMAIAKTGPPTTGEQRAAVYKAMIDAMVAKFREFTPQGTGP